jgi:hypothetical protein
MPASAAYFTARDESPSFGNYGFGTAATFNLNRLVGIEGEIGSMRATRIAFTPAWSSTPRGKSSD